MVAVFVAIYLYQSGYSLLFIACFFACMFGLRAFFAYPSAFIIARVGPKHATLLANLLSIPALLCLATLESFGVGSLIFYLVFYAASNSLYIISHHVDFSKIKHRLHAGKEIGYMVALERIAMAVSPLLGGVIAYVFGPQATIITAVVLFAVAAWPLLLSPEPVRIHQRITFKYIAWPKVYRSLIAQSALSWDFIATGIVWSLFVALAVFGTETDAVYAQVGAVASVAIASSLITVRVYGALIDKHRGGDLLRLGAIGTGLIHLIRPFISTSAGVVLANVSSEAAKSAYNMPFIKGAFDLADNLPGYRIVYMALIDIAGCIGAALGLLTLGALTTFFDDIGSLQMFYFVSAAVVLAITLHGLPALRTYRH
jgi:MFS family permease